MPTRKRVTPCLREATRRLRANCFAKRKTTSNANGASTPTVPPCRAEAKLPISLHTNRKRPPSRPSRKEAKKNERHFHSIFRLGAEIASRGVRISPLRIRAEHSRTRRRRHRRGGPSIAF